MAGAVRISGIQARAAAIELLRAHGYDVIDVVLRDQMRSMLSEAWNPFRLSDRTQLLQSDLDVQTTTSRES